MGLLDSVIPPQIGAYPISEQERKRLLKTGLLSAGLTMMATPTGTGSPLMGISRGLLAGIETAHDGALDSLKAQHALQGSKPAEQQYAEWLLANAPPEQRDQVLGVLAGYRARPATGGYGFEQVETADGRKRTQRRNPRTGAVEVLVGNQWQPLGAADSGYSPTGGLLASPADRPATGLLGVPLGEDQIAPTPLRAEPFASRLPEETTLATERARNQAARELMPYQVSQAGAVANASTRATALANFDTASDQGHTAATIEASRQQGQDAAKEFTTLQSKAQSAQAENANLIQLRNSLAKSYTGPGADAALGAKRAAAMFGINVDGLGEAEAARALSNRMALALRNPAGGEGMPGALSNADREFLLESIPNLQSSPAGWRAMVDMRLALNGAAIQQAQMAEQMRRNGVPVQDIPGILRQQANENPIFKPRKQKERASEGDVIENDHGVRLQLRGGQWVKVN